MTIPRVMPPADKMTMKKARRDERERNLAAKILALPGRRYGVMLADAGWRFEPWSRETGMDRAADNHYATSTVEQIKAIDVASIAAVDCALFLWATAPMMSQALEVMRAWGFTYKSQIVWDKEISGTGYWFRNRHELLLVGTRGNVPAPAMGTQWPSVNIERRRAHSVKPEWAYQMIEGYFPTLPKIELFARCARPGWDCWGFEAPATEGRDG
jgi:N6-adenosine-specific RNA methylase IME4